MDKILFDIRDEVHNFQAVIYEIDMPVVDIDAFFSQLFDCFVYLHLMETRLTELIDSVSWSDGMFESLAENIDIDNGQRHRIYNALMSLINATKSSLIPINPYDGGVFHYRYERILHDNTIVLAKIQGPKPSTREHYYSNMR